MAFPAESLKKDILKQVLGRFIEVQTAAVFTSQQYNKVLLGKELIGGILACMSAETMDEEAWLQAVRVRELAIHFAAELLAHDVVTISDASYILQQLRSRITAGEQSARSCTELLQRYISDKRKRIQNELPTLKRAIPAPMTVHLRREIPHLHPICGNAPTMLSQPQLVSRFEKGYSSRRPPKFQGSKQWQKQKGRYSVSSPKQSQETSKTVLISGIGLDVKVSELRDEVQSCGTVKALHIHLSPHDNTGNSALGFFEYETEEQARMLINKNQQKLRHKSLFIAFARTPIRDRQESALQSILSGEGDIRSFLERRKK